MKRKLKNPSSKPTHESRSRIKHGRGPFLTIKIVHYKHKTNVSISFKRFKLGTFRESIGRKTHTILGIILVLAGIIGLNIVIHPYIEIPTSQINFQASRLPVKSINDTDARPRTFTMPKSYPTHLSVKSIGLETDLISTGKNDKGEIAVPERFDAAAWYDLSPTPGELGPAVIVGHLSSYWGGAVFENLAKIAVNDIIDVNRKDGTIAKFKVESIQQYAQLSFPTEVVYGNIDYAGLRLITCGGAYNYLTGRYTTNTIVFARLTH